MTAFKMGLYGSFSHPSGTGMCHGSITPVTSVARSQQVTSSRWQPTGSFSPLLPQAMDTLSTEQAAEIYQLAAECQALGSKLTKQFQNLSALEAVHHAAAQAAAHETINAGCMACSTAFGIATATQNRQGTSMCRLHVEANQAWKDANEVIFSHLLQYDTQLAAFICAAEGTLQAKHDEIWRHVHSLTDTANIPHRICLPLALQILDQLPAIPWDLSYHTDIPLMFTYGPESYDFQTWSAAGNGDYLLDNDTWATNLLFRKLAHMAGRAGPDDPSLIRTASPTSSASSAVPRSPAYSPSRSHSRTRICKTEKERSCSSSASSTHFQETKPESPVASDGEDGNEGDSASQEGNESEEKDQADSNGGAPDYSKGSDGGSSDGEGSGGGGEISDANGHDEDSDGETDESGSETEESDTESSSSSSESDDETPTKATLPTKETPGSIPNTSQTLSLPDLDSKDLKEEWKIQRCKYAHLLDEKFGKWRDQMIGKGHNEGNRHDTMTCDHADSCKEAKFPDPIGLPLEYMKHYRVFNAKKTSDYDLCHFYEVGLSGDLPDFPSPREPAARE